MSSAAAAETGSYQFEKLEERHVEGSLLAERAQMRLEGFIPLLRRHGFPGQGKALEVGCAQGIRTRLMAAEFRGVEVTGVDREAPELLESARLAGAPASNLSFVAADLYELPFPDATFDFVYCRLVFMHLRNPAQAIAELKRVLRPGGRLLIEDGDRDCMFFEPAPGSFAPFWKKVQEGQRRLGGGDPNIGRKLAPLLWESGFQDVRIEAQPITGGGADIAFLVRTLMPSLNLYQPAEDRVAGERAIGDLARLADDPRATFYHLWFVVSGARA